jgi:hypothetical protein
MGKIQTSAWLKNGKFTDYPRGDLSLIATVPEIFNSAIALQHQTEKFQTMRSLSSKIGACVQVFMCPFR